MIAPSLVIRLSCSLSRLADVFFPRTCKCCGGRLLDGERHVCSGCLASWPRVIYTSVEDNELARLFWGVSPVEGAAAAFRYASHGVMSRPVHTMKYHGDAALCRFMGRVMAGEPLCEEILSGADFLVPVPLAAERERKRGYNQSRELCRGMSSVWQIPIADSLIQRNHYAQSQTHLSTGERAENVHGAFALGDTAGYEGMHIVLVDDIITTGATIRECLSVLRRVPGIRISVLALAKTGQ